MKRLIITAVTVFYITNFVQGQANNKLITEMKKLQETYRAASSLSFDVKYLYATESKPSAYLDSIKGRMEINGNNYRVLLNNTETIKNDRYVIHVFNDDKLIYLSKPSPESPGTGPQALIDSALANLAKLSWRIDSNAKVKRLVLSFPKQSDYKTVVFTINKTTGYITQAKYTVKTEQLLEMQNRDRADGVYDAYGIVEAVYSNYREGKNSSDFFDEKTIFVKNGNEYVPVEKFKDYSIFLGSPNL